MTLRDLVIAVTPVTAPDALRLIAESEEELAGLYAPEHRSAFSPDQLVRAGVVFMVGRGDAGRAGAGEPLVCGGYARLSEPDGAPYAELKRVFTTARARGRGLGRRLIDALERHAAAAGLTLMRLETGEASPDAIALYERCGYARRGPFGGYRENGSSVFMEKRLALTEDAL